MTEKACTRCKITRPLSEFSSSTRTKDGKHSWCRQCAREAAADRWRKAHPERVPIQDRLCGICRERKPLDAFAPTHWRCRECSTAAARDARQADPSLSRKSNLWLRYRLTIEQYEIVLEDQEGCCAICRRPPGGNRLHVDHDHRCCPTLPTCGMCTRGLVCYSCNIKLSVLDTDSEYALAMRGYLGVEVVRRDVDAATLRIRRLLGTEVSDAA